jgi:hypothetical protein
MFYRIGIICLLLLAYLVPSAAWAVSPAGIRADIEARYKISSLDFFGNVKVNGTVLVVWKDGLRADRPGVSNKATVIRDRQVATVGGGTIPLGGNVDGELKVGDRLRLFGVRVDDNYVELDLSTEKTYVVTGTRGPTSLQAIIRFQYDNGLASVATRQVLDDIGAWFRTENAVQVSKTVQQGQTPEEVVDILGEPEKRILLGPKTVFIYKDMKLVFKDGKLVDME